MDQFEKIIDALNIDLEDKFEVIGNTRIDKGGCASIFKARAVRKGEGSTPETKEEECLQEFTVIKVLRISNADKDGMQKDIVEERELLDSFAHPSFAVGA